jgi:hypothetical protein
VDAGLAPTSTESKASRKPAESIERAVGNVYADGIKPMEFGGSNGMADIAKAVIAALQGRERVARFSQRRT